MHSGILFKCYSVGFGAERIKFCSSLSSRGNRFLATLITVRLGHKGSLAQRTPLDAVLLVILAAVLSRAINGSSAFFPTIGGGGWFWC